MSETPDRPGATIVVPARPRTPRPQPPSMSGEEFTRICTRLFPGAGQGWKHQVARALDRAWNTIWCYASGRRNIPEDIADEVREWDRLMNESMAKLAAETPEERRQRLLRFLDEMHPGDHQVIR